MRQSLPLDRHKVTLLERDQLGCRASGAAAGDLSPHNEESGGTPEPAARSLEMFPELAFDEEEAARLKASGGLWLDAQACRDAEPSLTSDVLDSCARSPGPRLRCSA